MTEPKTEEPDDPIQALEHFVMHNPELDELESRLSVFNVFEILNIAQVEIRHSNMLAWLLDPRGSHGVGHQFLKRFLQTTVADNRESLGAELPVLELDMLDYSDIEIRREWENVDLLIICRDPELQFVIAIENKILSGEHDLQLIRYFKSLNKQFEGYRRIHLFLSPDGRPPVDDESWVAVSYSAVLDCLQYAVDISGGNLSEDVARFIDHYKEILRRYVVGDERLEELCRKIYANHPKALDLLFEYRPDLLADIRVHLEEWIKDHKPDGIIYDSGSKTAIRMTHKDIDKVDPKGAAGWTKSKRILLFEFSNYYDGLVLRFVVGPGSQANREKLKAHFAKNPTVFNRTGKSSGKKWNTVYQKSILRKNDVDGAVFGDVVSKIDKGLQAFLEVDLPKIIAHIAKLKNA